MKRLLLALLLPALLGAASPEARRDLSAFARIPILHEGRVKPLDTYARAQLLAWSSRSSLGREKAASFLARCLFDPESTATNQIFRINHPETARALGIEPEPKFRYSFRQIEPALSTLAEMARRIEEIPEKERGPVEKELFRLFVNLNSYLELSGSLRFALPAEAFQVATPEVRTALGLSASEERLTYLQAKARVGALMPFVKRAAGGENSPAVSEAVSLARALKLYDDFYARFTLPVLPVAVGAGAEDPVEWKSPWALAAKPNPDARVGEWAALSAAWREADEKRFSEIATRIASDSDAVLRAHPSVRAFPRFEVFHNRFDAFTWATIFYTLGLVLSFTLLAFAPGGRNFRIFARATWAILGVAALLEIFGIASRMTITGRPPITNLYETFLFVSTICALGGLLLERILRNGMGLLVAAASGFAILLVAGRFAAEGDTLKVLVAVLDSNFWLTTHVIAINLGYAGCVLSGVIAHVFLVKWMLGHEGETQKRLSGAVYGVQAIGLIFTFVGTMLGGVWADQSWGRFWGWDPKENGALLILLWSSILFHARLTGWLRDAGFAVGSVIGIVVVMMAWFGINLLGVGLHSYGFTSGIATALFGYVALQLVFLVTVAWIRTLRQAGLEKKA